MSVSNNLESEIGYVRELVDKSERSPSPAAIYWMWALIGLVGFSLVDFAPNYVGIYWMIAGPVGGVASALMGWRYSVRRGQVRRDLGVRHSLHWFGMMAAIFMAVPLGVTGAVAWEELYKVFLLLLAVGYFTAGVHLDRPLVWVGLLMAAGYVALYFIPAYGWTVVGILVAIGLAATAIIGGRSGATTN